MESLCYQCQKQFASKTLLDMHQRYCKYKPGNVANYQNNNLNLKEPTSLISNSQYQENDKLICDHCGLTYDIINVEEYLIHTEKCTDSIAFNKLNDNKSDKSNLYSDIEENENNKMDIDYTFDVLNNNNHTRINFNSHNNPNNLTIQNNLIINGTNSNINNSNYSNYYEEQADIYDDDYSENNNENSIYSDEIHIHNGLSNNELSFLLSEKFKENRNIKSDCFICLEKIKMDEEIIRLPCLHFYHSQEIKNWLLSNSTCPECRINIKEFIEKEYNI